MLITTYKLHYRLKSLCHFFQSPFISTGNKGKLNYFYATNKKSITIFPLIFVYNLCTDFRLLQHSWCLVESSLSFLFMKNVGNACALILQSTKTSISGKWKKRDWTNICLQTPKWNLKSHLGKSRKQVVKS